MSNSTVKTRQKKNETSISRPAGMIGDYATIEEAIEAKKAQLLETVPHLNLSVLLQHLGG